MKLKHIYTIIGILLILSFMNIFLGNILFKNINIELYNPNKDIQNNGKVIYESIEKNAIHNSQNEIKNNGNTEGDNTLKQLKEDKYTNKMSDIIDNGKSINECYTFEKDIDKDNCMKDYSSMLLSGLKKVGNPKYYNLETVTSYCSYGQRTKDEINNCIKIMYIGNPINLLQCSDIFKNNEELELICFEEEFGDYINNYTAGKYSSLLLELNQGLVKIDSKGRVITKKVDSKTLRSHPEYTTMFQYVQPYFIDKEILENPIIKNNTHLYNFLTNKVEYYNNVNQFDVFQNSLFKKKNPQLFN